MVWSVSPYYGTAAVRLASIMKVAYHLKSIFVLPPSNNLLSLQQQKASYNDSNDQWD